MALDMFWDSATGGYQQIYVDTFVPFDGTVHAWNPNPGNKQNNVSQEAILTWSAPERVDTVTYDVYLVKDDNDPNTDPISGAAAATGISGTSYDPTPDLDSQSKYYWRVDVHGMGEDPNTVSDPNYDPENPVYDTPIDVTGYVWEFNTAGKASNPVPVDAAIEVHPSAILEWDGLVGYKQDVYFGTDSAEVAAADINTVGIYQGRQDAAVTTFDPYDADWMEWSTSYYWRIDEVDESTDPDTIIPGPVWSFRTIVPVCAIPIPIDVNGNCTVDLAEFAALAEMWLECYWIPEEFCP